MVQLKNYFRVNKVDSADKVLLIKHNNFKK